MIRLVLFQPDIPQNFGAAQRLCACMAAELHVIEPCGFLFSNAKLKRSAMDYASQSPPIRHVDFSAFQTYRLQHPGALLLLETDGTTNYTQHRYAPGDYILLGRESCGTPRELYSAMNATLHIPMQPGFRSLNVAMAAGMVVAEACRQLKLHKE
jgi:tRNA (cytidine/uridine-2'-O-)-methyltransferase